MTIKTTTRREFVKTTGLGLVTLATGCGIQAPNRKINKREAVLSLLNEDKKQDYTPAGFFIHFGGEYMRGDSAINRHLEYFNAIDMDFVKVQYEKVYPVLSTIHVPGDWEKTPSYRMGFYEEQLYVVKGLIDRAKHVAPVIATLYSPFMCARDSTSNEIINEHLKENPESVKKGLEIITENVLFFAKECMNLGVDGFLACTQGGEANRFEDRSIFEQYIKPYDLLVMEEINASCNCNILHICDYHGDYDDLTPFLGYPGQAVNCCLDLGGERQSPSYMYDLFDRPFMGGLEKRGIITSGTEQQIKNAVTDVMSEASEKFILGSSCTLPGDISWNNIRTAVDVAHQYS